MKKVFLTLVLMLIIAGIGAPVLNGIMMEQVVKNAVDHIRTGHAETGTDMEIRIVQYDRNFLSSKIQWEISPGALGRIYGIENIILIQRAEHGIFGITSRTSLEKNKWFSTLIETKLNGKNPLVIHTRYEILGNIRSTLTLDNFSIREGDKIVNILPAHFFIQSDKEGKNFILKGNWEGIIAPGKIKLTGVSLGSTQNKISPFIWQGSTLISAEHLFLDDGQKHFEMTGFTSDTSMDYDKNTNSISLGMACGIAEIKSQAETVLNAFVQLGINKIDARGYEEIVKIYSRQVNRTLKDISDSRQSSDSMPDRMADYIAERIKKQIPRIAPQLLTACEKGLKKGAEIKITDLRAQLPQGKVKGNISIRLNQEITMLQFITIAIQPGAAFDLFSLKSNISLPHGLTGDNPNLLSPVYPGMQTGLFLKKGDKLTHRADTRDGKLFVNGQEVLFN